MFQLRASADSTIPTDELWHSVFGFHSILQHINIVYTNQNTLLSQDTSHLFPTLRYYVLPRAVAIAIITVVFVIATRSTFDDVYTISVASLVTVQKVRNIIRTRHSAYLIRLRDLAANYTFWNPIEHSTSINGCFQNKNTEQSNIVDTARSNIYGIIFVVDNYTFLRK